MLTHLRSAWSLTTLPVKAGIIVTGVILIALAIGMTHRLVSSYKDRRADAAIAAERAKSEEHRQRADEAEAKAKELVTQVALQEVAIQAAGTKATAIAEKVKTEDAKLVEEMQRIGEPINDPCERVRRVCARSGIAPKDCACTSN